MGLESSQERPEQERPRSATPAETDHSPAVQGESGGEQLPANATSASVWPDSDELVALLLSWIGTPDWSTSQTYLQAHSELLTEAAEQVLVTLAQHQPDPQAHELLTQYQLVLQAARQQGVESAYELLLQRGDEAERASNDLKELENQLIAWFQAPDWAASQTYLQAHTHLLTERAEQVLEQLKHAQPEEEMQELISERQLLLHEARTWGIDGAYTYFQLAEQATILDEHEQETLLAQLNEWLDAPEWQQAQAYLEEHPDLLTGAAEYLLASWWLVQQTYREQVSVAWHLLILQRARAYGVIATYSWLPDADSLNNAGLEAVQAYWTSGEMGVLEQALECWQQALLLTLPDSSERPMYLINLSEGLRNRYARTGVLGDLEQAIAYCQQAVEATPLNSPDYPALLSNLGLGLLDRYMRTGAPDNLEQAISAHQ